MAGHIIFNGISINNIIDEIKVESKRNYRTSEYVGSTGSDTSYISEESKVITFSNLCMHYEESTQGNKHRINDYLDLSTQFKNKTGVLTSQSNLDLKGNYIITQFEPVEDTMGNFTIQWELTEKSVFNVTKTTFRVWGKSSSSKNSKTTTTKKSGSNLSSNTKYLLKTCGLMSKGSKSTKCVKCLQKFLQSGGYYKGYTVDGVYGTYTVKAMKQAQKKKGLKQTGKWDKNTRNYYRKKYNYPK